MTAPSNDAFVDAQGITLETIYSDTLEFATSEFHEFYALAGGDEPTAASYAAFYDHTTWHRWDVPADGTATFSLESDDGSVSVVYQATIDPAALENITVLAEASPGSPVVQPVLAGEVYYVQVVNTDVGTWGTYTLQLSFPPPANDNFADAETLVADFEYVRTLADATTEFHEYFALFGGDEATAESIRASYTHSVWYVTEITEDGSLSVTIDGGDALAAIYLAGSPPDLDTLTSLGLATNGGGPFTTSVLTGEVYYVQVFSTDEPTWEAYHLTVSGAGGGGGGGPVALAGDVTATATASGDLSVPHFIGLSASVTADAAASGALARNTLAATVHAGASIRAWLRIDDNIRVEPWFGDAGEPSPTPPTADPTLNGPAGIQVVEYIGPAGDELPVDEYLNLLAADAHSHGERGFAQHPIGPGTGIHRSVERWMRVRVLAPFNAMVGLRFWAENLDLEPGWTMHYGVTDTYATPTSAASSVAVSSLPTADPGLGAPNLLSAPLIGPADSFSRWLVLQAVCDTDVAGRQPIGYASESWAPIPIQLRFAWAET